MSKLLFEEKQSFRKTTWMYILLLSIAAVSFFPFVFSSLDEIKLVIYILIITFGLFGYIFFGSTLYLKIYTERIELAFPPFFWAKRSISIQEIRNWEVRSFSAMSEFGGWGWRKGFAGTGYIVNGDRVLEIEDEKGKKIMITTLQPAKVNDAMKILSQEIHPS